MNVGGIMWYRILTDLVVLVHFFFIVFAVTGGFIALYKRWIIWLHIPVACWAALIEFTGWICPLTPLENLLRQAGGELGYNGGFIEHYLIPIIYPQPLTRNFQIILGITVIGINIIPYALLFCRKRKR